MKIKTFFTKSLVYFSACAVACVANAAETGRGRVSMMPTVHEGQANPSRMPTIPVVSMNTVGNPAVGTVTEPEELNSGIVIPKPVPPTPSDCADGGVKNTQYNVAMCMNELQVCVNTGAVEGGLHGLFNNDYFLRVLNGNIRVCQNVVDKCLTIRKDCKNVYKTNRSVWADFRSRILMPEYYNFVLYKTGLTPNQAKKACVRLGAKWDAVNAECQVEVVAYNKSKPISNEWLFGVAGNGKDATAWLKTGTSFTCNKNLFGFSLLNDTATTAAISAGAVVIGATTGGLIAKAKQNKVKRQQYKDMCESKDFRKRFGAKIAQSHKDLVLKTYFADVKLDDNNEFDPDLTQMIMQDVDFYNLDKDQCDAILGLYSKAQLYYSAIEHCEDVETNKTILEILNKKISGDNLTYASEVQFETDTGRITQLVYSDVRCSVDDASLTEEQVKNFNNVCMYKPLQVGLLILTDDSPYCNTYGKCLNAWQIKRELAKLEGLLNELSTSLDTSAPSIGKGILVGGGVTAAAGGIATAIVAGIESNNIKCVVGNDWGSVSLGKSYSIDSLKDLYVKHGFMFPDSVVSTVLVVDKASWELACSEYAGNAEDCPNAQIVYKDNNGRDVVSAACEVSGNMCVMNEDVAQTRLPQMAY